MHLTNRPIFYCVAIICAVLSGCSSGPKRVTVPAPPPHDTAAARQQNDRAFELIEKGKYADAEKLLREALRADDAFWPAHANLGLVYLQTEHLYEAAWEFERAAKLAPNQPDVLNNLGLVYQRADKRQEAVQAFDRAHATQPGNPEYAANAAMAHVLRGDHDSATAALLEQVVGQDARPDWRHWARMALFRLRTAEKEAATTQPAAP